MVKVTNNSPATFTEELLKQYTVCKYKDEFITKYNKLKFLYSHEKEEMSVEYIYDNDIISVMVFPVCFSQGTTVYLRRMFLKLADYDDNKVIINQIKIGHCENKIMVAFCRDDKIYSTRFVSYKGNRFVLSDLLGLLSMRVQE